MHSPTEQIIRPVGETFEPTQQDLYDKKLRRLPVSGKTFGSEEQGLSSVGSTEDLIRGRAYELYERRGREDGHDLEDWLEAEAEILTL